MSRFSVRQAAIDDDPRITDLLEASYPELMKTHYESAVLISALPLMTRANPQLLGSGTYYVAETDNQLIIGCGGWTMNRPDTGTIVEGTAHLRHFATHPDFTGKGIGRLIYDACERTAKSAGVNLFECFASLNAQGYYKALGFEPVELVWVELRPEQLFESMLMKRGI
jgi:N-acetylglutamate synthase-like GNAT family acetyltransferase